MSLVSINGLDASWAHAVRPLRGVWHLDATVAASGGISTGDVVTVELGGMTLVGRALRPQAHEDLLRLRVVGGDAGMATLAVAKFYQGARARLVLEDLLAAAGERLAATSNVAALDDVLPAWSTLARPVAVELETLLGIVAPQANWRLLDSGSLWVGVESWPDSSQVYELLDRDPARRRITLGCEAPSLLPGETLGGERIADVEYMIGAAGARIVARLA